MRRKNRAQLPVASAPHPQPRPFVWFPLAHERHAIDRRDCDVPLGAPMRCLCGQIHTMQEWPIFYADTPTSSRGFPKSFNAMPVDGLTNRTCRHSYLLSLMRNSKLVWRYLALRPRASHPHIVDWPTGQLAKLLDPAVVSPMANNCHYHVVRRVTSTVSHGMVPSALRPYWRSRLLTVGRQKSVTCSDLDIHVRR